MNLNDLTEAFSAKNHPWETADNPQAFEFMVSQYVSPTPKRHVLGLVGGNAVSLIQGNMVDLESDLRGINIPNTFCPWKQYQPPPHKSTEIIRDNRKIGLKIDIAPNHLDPYQMWAYPGMPAPAPMYSQVCRQPEKY